MNIEVFFYAQLKDYFGDKLMLEVSDGATAAEIRNRLSEKNALAADWLKVSRLASDDAFLSEDFTMAAGGRYYLLPPSSGG